MKTNSCTMQATGSAFNQLSNQLKSLFLGLQHNQVSALACLLACRQALLAARCTLPTCDLLTMYIILYTPILPIV